METSTTHCTSCGLIPQHCQCHEKKLEITPAFLCSCYSFWTVSISLLVLLSMAPTLIFHTKPGCFLELFAHSVSVSNANATADWRIGLVARSPVSGCKIHLHTIESRLLRGDAVISESSRDSFGQLVFYDSDGPEVNVGFERVAMPGVTGGVVRDYRVEIHVGVEVDTGLGFLMVLCGDLPVKFTAGPEGNMMGKLLGNMKRCDAHRVTIYY